MKKNFATAAALAAAIALNGCTATVDMTASDGGELRYRSSRPDSEVSVEEADTSYAAGMTVDSDSDDHEYHAEAEDITMPSDNSLTVLIGDDHEELLESCNELFESLGGKLNIEVADSDLLYDSIAKGTISDKPIDVSTFDNGMLFPYLAVEDVIAPINILSLPDIAEDLSNVADMFSINNWRYLLPLRYEQAYRLLYDTDTLKKYKLEDPDELSDSEWTLEKLCELSRQYSKKGGKYPLSGKYGEPLNIATGEPLVKYERDPTGFFNNLFDPKMADVTDMLYGLTEDDISLTQKFSSPAEGLRSGVLFYAATLFEAQSDELPETVKTAAVPTLEGIDRSTELKVYGLTLMKASKHYDAAECYFKCAIQSVEAHSHGAFAYDYAAFELDNMVYPYDKGISPGVSYSPAHMNDDHPMCVSELMYSELANRDDWGGICAYYTHRVHADLTTLNNKIRSEIYGD